MSDLRAAAQAVVDAWVDDESGVETFDPEVIGRLAAAVSRTDRLWREAVALSGVPEGMLAAPRRVSFLVQSDFDRLEDWCRLIRVIFGRAPYLVGSATQRADYRDVDVRLVLPDDEFDRHSRGRLDSIRFLNRALSVWGQQETGLPLDFQVQRETEADAEFPERTNAMGVRDWSHIPTSGVAARQPVPEDAP